MLLAIHRRCGRQAVGIKQRQVLGVQPLRGLAQPLSSSALRNSWRRNGYSPASAFHSGSGISLMLPRVRSCSAAVVARAAREAAHTVSALLAPLVAA